MFKILESDRFQHHFVILTLGVILFSFLGVTPWWSFLIPALLLITFYVIVIALMLIIFGLMYLFTIFVERFM